MWDIILDRKSELPLKKQLYQVLRGYMTGGRLQGGEELPSTRELSNQLRISRNTATEAYEMLLAEGFIISRQGAATRVAEGLTIECSDREPRRLEKHTRDIKVSFQTGRPDLKLFPRFLWRQYLNKAADEMPAEMYGYTGPQGLEELRTEIAAWLFRNRGIGVDPTDIFITSGATQALHLTVDLLECSGRTILMEDPCHKGMLQTFVNRGCVISPVPADADGMDTSVLPAPGDARAVYVTPSHQFPLGGILPASRRAALIRYAQENGLYIIEDDYDSEFRYCGDPVAPLFALDPQKVIYVGTFSKVLFPALRIGYAVLPQSLQRRWRELRTYLDVQNPLFEQAALAAFLKDRKLDKHMKRMRGFYGERRVALLYALEETFGSAWTAIGDAAGLHLTAEFPDRVFNEVFRIACLREGLLITPLEVHCIQKGRHRNKLLLGYGHLEPEEIRSGVHMLRDIMNKRCET